jgi:mono/diheme cytochrome c family protein
MRTSLALVILAFAAPAMAADETEGDQAAGLAYARANCTECHAVDAGDFASPDLDAPGFAEIANTRGMSELALVSFFQTDHPTMPNFVVPAPAIRDLIAYIRSLKD